MVSLNKDIVIVTNNKACYAMFRENDCRFDDDWDYGKVLLEARGLVHQQYVLRTHPLAGSLKPNQTPYRSILLSKTVGKTEEEFNSVALIEKAIDIFIQFQNDKPTPLWSEQILKDFREVDLSLIVSAVASINLAGG